MQCKSCLVEVHYCGSCDYDFFSSKGYCSKKCFHNSKEYLDNINLIKNLWSSLDIEQQKGVEKLLGMDEYFRYLDFDKLVVPKKEVIILVGNIGSGKSTAAQKLQQEGYVVVSRDSFRFGIGAGQYIFNTDYETIIKTTAFEYFQKFLKLGVNIIVDETNMAKSSREHYIKAAKEQGYKVKALVMPRISKEESINRRMSHPANQSKEKWESVWEMFDTHYVRPSVEEGFDKVIDYNGENNEKN